MKCALIVASVAVALLSGGALWRAAATAGSAVKSVPSDSAVFDIGFPVAAQAALGRRVLVLHADPAKPRTGRILESGRAPEGWTLFPGAPPGADDFAASLDALGARAAAAFDRERGLPADVEQALALFAVKAVLVDDGGKGAAPLRTLDHAEPVLRLDADGGAASADASDPVHFAASLKTSFPRESAGWTASDWEDAMWGGAVTIDSTQAARFVFPHPAAGANVSVNGASVSPSHVGPLLVLDLPAGRSRVEVRFLEPGAGETLAVVGAAGLVAAILTLLVALRPSRADVEAGAAREALDAGPSGAAR